MKNIHLVCILDRSGSMSGLEEDTIGGYNSFLKRYEDQTNVSVTTVLFDHAFTLLYDKVRVEQARLNTSNYTVRGATALLDAVGHTVNLVKTKDYFEEKTEQRIYIITTDGLENASALYHHKDIHQLIAKERKKGHEFVFLGANIDAFAEAENLGITREYVHQYEASKEGTKKMYQTMSKMVCSVMKEKS